MKEWITNPNAADLYFRWNPKRGPRIMDVGYSPSGGSRIFCLAD